MRWNRSKQVVMKRKETKDQNVTMAKWNNINWKRVNKNVFNWQKEIYVAITKVDGSKDLLGREKVYQRQRKARHTFERRAKAVRQVTVSSGGKTPGVDGVVLSESTQKWAQIGILRKVVQNTKSYKAEGYREISIPKPGTNEKRKLRIPTIGDRALQALYCSVVDPAVEAVSDERSFGFRRGRGPQDACSYRHIIFKGTKGMSRWFFETDIEKCFDRISHSFRLENTPMCDKDVLRAFLEAGRATEGTPQGGVISPRLCNVALNGIEKYVKDEREKWTAGLKVNQSTKKKRQNVKVVRYADDIIVSIMIQESEECVRNALTAFLKVRGLNIKEGKTKSGST